MLLQINDVQTIEVESDPGNPWLRLDEQKPKKGLFCAFICADGAKRIGFGGGAELSYALQYQQHDFARLQRGDKTLSPVFWRRGRVREGFLIDE